MQRHFVFLVLGHGIYNLGWVRNVMRRLIQIPITVRSTSTSILCFMPIYIYIVKSLGNFLHCFWLGFVTESAYVLTEMVKTSTSVFYSKLLHIEGLFNLQICFWACILVMTILPPNKMLLHACMLVIIRWSTLRKCTCVQNLHFLFLVLSSRTSILRL